MKSMNTDSINEHYSADHDRLDDLFRQFQTLKVSDRQKAVAAFKEFQAGLERHILWEEEILFPSFERKTGHTGGPTEMMRWEHRQIRGFLDAIADKLAQAGGDTASEEMGLLSVLEAHNQKEEGILYPMIDQMTGAEERTEIFAEMSQTI
jgi:iron-sulfur cluster repair protein YtfE (RIC family)